MLRTLKVGIALAAAFGIYQAAALANSQPVGGGSSMSSSSGVSMEAMARDAYNSGIGHRNNALKAEEQALKQNEKDRVKTLQKVKDEYTKALKDFKSAYDMDPTLYQAVNGMAYAYRKTGDPAKALQLYDTALKMAPRFADAIEYRAEAYLALNRVEDAKQSYLTLFGIDRKQADQLLKVMTDWVKARQEKPAEVDPQVIAALDTWIKERQAIAVTTSAMGLTGSRSVWN